MYGFNQQARPSACFTFSLVRSLREPRIRDKRRSTRVARLFAVLIEQIIERHLDSLREDATKPNGSTFRIRVMDHRKRIPQRSTRLHGVKRAFSRTLIEVLLVRGALRPARAAT